MSNLDDELAVFKLFLEYGSPTKDEVVEGLRAISDRNGVSSVGLPKSVKAATPEYEPLHVLLKKFDIPVTNGAALEKLRLMGYLQWSHPRFLLTKDGEEFAMQKGDAILWRRDKFERVARMLIRSLNMS